GADALRNRYRRHAHELGDGQAGDAIVPVSRLAAADNEVDVADLVDRSLERHGGAVAVAIEQGRVVEQDALVASHRQAGLDHVTRRLRSEAEDGDFAT